MERDESRDAVTFQHTENAIEGKKTLHVKEVSELRIYFFIMLAAGIAQSVERLATGWTVRGSNLGGGARFSAPVQTGPGAHPASYTMGTGSFVGVKRPVRGADPPPPSSVPRS